MAERWEHYRHEADIGVRGLGASKTEAFEQAALAMTAAVTDLDSVAPREAVDPARHHPAVEVKGATYTTLRVARDGDAWSAQTVIDV